VSDIPKPPMGAGPAGRRLWRSVLSEFDLAEHELALLRQAVHVADLCEQLRATVDREGALLDSRTHPAMTELRQQRVLLARLVVALRVPLGEQKSGPQRTQYRGTRGVYGIRGLA
jgi:hypothetical protein